VAVNVIIGWAVFVAALIIWVGLIMVIAAAFRSLSPRSSPESTTHVFRSMSAGPSPERRGTPPANCYWDCMNDFHWSEGWEELCAPVCGLQDRHAEVFYPGSVYRL